jgi:hypothetical protein
MTIRIDSTFFLSLFGIWYAIGFASLLFWNIVGQGRKGVWRELINKFWTTSWEYVAGSLFGPILFLYGLLVWVIFDSILNRKK